MVDPRGLFMCADVGLPGRFHDAAALRQSRLWHHHHRLFSSQKDAATGDGFCIYGDSAYPLREWILFLAGYRNRFKTTDERAFNKRGSRARVVVEMAFGKVSFNASACLRSPIFHLINSCQYSPQLKGQWRLLANGTAYSHTRKLVHHN